MIGCYTMNYRVQAHFRLWGNKWIILLNKTPKLISVLHGRNTFMLKAVKNKNRMTTYHGDELRLETDRKCLNGL